MAKKELKVEWTLVSSYCHEVYYMSVVRSSHSLATCPELTLANQHPTLSDPVFLDGSGAREVFGIRSNAMVIVSDSPVVPKDAT
jgi:hypothetical protein